MQDGPSLFHYRTDRRGDEVTYDAINHEASLSSVRRAYRDEVINDFPDRFQL
jgi:hypothetical protein